MKNCAVKTMLLLLVPATCLASQLPTAVEFGYPKVREFRLGMHVSELERVTGQRIGLKKGESLAPYIGSVSVPPHNPATGVASQYVGVWFDAHKRLKQVFARTPDGWDKGRALAVLSAIGPVKKLDVAYSVSDQDGNEVTPEQFRVCLAPKQSLALFKRGDWLNWVWEQHYPGDGVCGY